MLSALEARWSVLHQRERSERGAERANEMIDIFLKGRRDRCLSRLQEAPRKMPPVPTSSSPPAEQQQQQEQQRILSALVIGAGPSGLVAAKYLLESTSPKYHVTILEASTHLGGTFVNKVYDNARLVSSKYITAFSDFRFDEDSTVCPNHPTVEQYVEYLERYAKKFDLMKHIQFGCKVILVEDASECSEKGNASSHIDVDIDIDTNGYTVKYLDSNGRAVSKHYDVVAVCSGLHNTPNIPPEFAPSSSLARKFKGKITHSSEYKDASIFNRKRVIILGSGETAMDIAHRAITNPLSESVAVCIRRGFLSIPHNLAEDRPLDVFITNLFEHSYEHPWVHKLRLRWWLSTIFIRAFLVLTGSSWGFNQWAAQTTPIRRGYHIINKSHAAMSHMNVAVKARWGMWGRFWMWVYGETNLRPIDTFHRTHVVDVEEDGATLRFDDGRTYQTDVIILATGYRQSFPFLHDDIKKRLRLERNTCFGIRTEKVEGSKYTHSANEDYLPSQHFITGTTRSRLGFIGFARPNVGAIPPMSEMQVMWWLQKMKGKVTMVPRTRMEPPSYMVLGHKYRYGVDYGNYMHRVAEDIGAAPSLGTLARSSEPLKMLFTYCIGQSHIPLFRLQGPYESKLCWSTCVEELWRVCVKRGWAENAGLLYMTWLSLLMNLMAMAIECIWCVCTLQKPKLFVRY